MSTAARLAEKEGKTARELLTDAAKWWNRNYPQKIDRDRIDTDCELLRRVPEHIPDYVQRFLAGTPAGKRMLNGNGAH